MLTKVIHGSATNQVAGLMSSEDKQLLTTISNTYVSTSALNSLLGANSGVATLDASGKIPSSQLPSYVDDVIEAAQVSAFPATGESGKIYVALDTNKTYRWSGSAYVEISESLALGETSSTAYRGDRGKIAYDHAVAKGSAFTSGLYKITTNAEGHVTAATTVVKADITGLGIPAQDTTYQSLAAVSEGTDVSLVTTGEKYKWEHSYLPLSGGTMTGQIILASTGYKTHNEAGYSVDNYGNFKHLRTATSDYHGWAKNNATVIAKLYWETGNFEITGSMTATSFIGSLTGNADTATADADGNTISSTYLKLSGGTMTGALTTAGSNIQLGTPSASSNDSGDIVWLYGNGNEKMRLHSSNNPTEKIGPAFRIFNASGQSLYSGNLPLADGTSATGTWNISITGTAAKATADADGNTISNTYLKLNGGTMTGNIRRYYSANSSEPLITALGNNVDICLWVFGHGTTAASTTSNSHYRLIYKGTGSSDSNSNYLQLIAHNSSDVIAVQVDEAGRVVFNKEITTHTINHYNSNNVIDSDWTMGTRGVKPTATTTDGKTTYSGAVVGTVYLTLGNDKIGANSASGVDDNAQGYLRIYASDSTYSTLTSYNTWIYPDRGLAIPVDKIGIMFRPNSTSYHVHVSHETSGNEALVFATQNTVTSFIFVNGESKANVSNTRWTQLTGASGAGNAPGLQIKKNCVSIGKLIANNVDPSYKLETNGGKIYFNYNTAPSNTLTSQLIIANEGETAVGIELWRKTKASWQIINDSGTLYFKNNYTTAVQTSYTQIGLIIDYNTNNTAINGCLSVGQAVRNTSYKLYVNGTGYFNNLLTLYRESTTTDNLPAGIIFSTKDTTVNKAYGSSYLYVYHDHGSTNGANMVMQPGGNLFIGSGEGPGNLYASYKASTAENVFIVSDDTLYTYANGQTIANRIGFAITTAGAIVPQKAEAANNNAQDIGAANNTWAHVYATNISIGVRETTTQPSSLTYSNRITIVPYFHTGGPWYIKSGDDNTNAHLALYYGSNNLVQIRHNAYITIGDSVCVTGSSWGNGVLMVGKNGTDKVVIGYLADSTKGAVVAGHTTTLQAWAPLNIAGASINFRMQQVLTAKILDGCLSLFPTSGDYREGLRIHAYNSWSDITLCGNDNTKDNGTSANSWFIGNNNGNFYIARNGSSSSSSAILKCVSNVWSWNGTATGNISGNAGTVSHTLATTTKYYISGTTLTATGNSAGTFDTGIYSTTTAGQLNATTYLVNEKVRLEYNSTDLSLDFVFV